METTRGTALAKHHDSERGKGRLDGEGVMSQEAAQCRDRGGGP